MVKKFQLSATEARDGTKDQSGKPQVEWVHWPLRNNLMVFWSEQVNPFSHKKMAQLQIYITSPRFPWLIVS